jgi:Ca2+-binding EF-hand superfamily protein
MLQRRKSQVLKSAIAQAAATAAANAQENEDEDAGGTLASLTKMLSLPSIGLFGRSDAAKAMMRVFDNNDGKLTELMRTLAVTAAEKKALLNMWLEIDGDRNNKMDYNEFIAYFNLADDVWSKRTFSIMNYNATDVVSFVEFLSFCVTYLAVDRYHTIEFTFRLLSRRGNAFNKAHHSIIDLDDMKHYISTRFAMKNLSKCKKRSGDIFKVMNRNGDGGVEIDEFVAYTAKNVTICAFAHHILMHLRRCIFGLEFWVSKSRKMKMAFGGALDHLIFFNSINTASEKFCAQMKQPVLDVKGSPIVTNLSTKANFDQSKPTLAWHVPFSMSG